jgi:hypothetical protein
LVVEAALLAGAGLAFFEVALADADADGEALLEEPFADGFLVALAAARLVVDGKGFNFPA